MKLLEQLKGIFRGKPLTPEQLAARQEAKLLKEQMLTDRLSQKGSGGTYRSGRGRS